MFIVYCTWHLPHCNTLLQQCPQTALLPWHWRQTQNKRVYFYCLWEKTGEKNKLQTISWQCLSVTMTGVDSHRSNMFFIVVYLSSALTGSSGFSIYVQQLCANTSHWMKYKIKQSYRKYAGIRFYMGGLLFVYFYQMGKYIKFPLNTRLRLNLIPLNQYHYFYLWDKQNGVNLYIAYEKHWSFPWRQVCGKTDIPILLLTMTVLENKKNLPGTILQSHPVTCACVRVNVIYLQVEHKVMETFLWDAVVESH